MFGKKEDHEYIFSQQIMITQGILKVSSVTCILIKRKPYKIGDMF